MVEHERWKVERARARERRGRERKRDRGSARVKKRDRDIDIQRQLQDERYGKIQGDTRSEIKQGGVTGDAGG